MTYCRQGPESECEPDASTAPVNEWRYRFNPLQEREQKRQYLNANGPADGLAWTYTLLGADARQLATYNGIQGPLCNQPAGTVWLWPVEYNAYGPANTRVILRPNGAKDYAIADHLGSVRLLLGDNGVIKEQRSYGPFGEDLISYGDGARTSYIGRENDHESNLGFFGVRHYDPTYGRFMSVDPLWAQYAPLQPYHYAGNEPVGRLDWDGREVEYRGNSNEREKLKSFYEQMIAHYMTNNAMWAASFLYFVRNTPSFTVKLELTCAEREYHRCGPDGKFRPPPSYNESNGTVFINPNAGAILENGAMSSFDIAFHEIIHSWFDMAFDYDRALRSSWRKNYRFCRTDSYGDERDCEEDFVIDTWETPLLRSVDQLFDSSRPSRVNHSGEPVRTTEPGEVPHPRVDTDSQEVGP